MKILGIETTCDETSAAIVEDGRFVLSNVVASSLEIHKKYGGVVPEIAAREQVRSILPVITEAVAQASRIKSYESRIKGPLKNKHLVNWAKENIDTIAVAHGPGLVGSLLVGVETAKALSATWQKPLIAVNHLIGHVYANWLERTTDYRLQTTAVDSRQSTVDFPAIALIVSGGHTDLILMNGHGKYRWLGGTLDDAAGEAFDKVARILGLGYPGGPEVERVSSRWSLVAGNQKLAFVPSSGRGETRYHLPRPMINSDDFDFSFSGLKTAVANLANNLQLTRLPARQATDNISAIANEFQEAIVDVLVAKTLRAARKFCTDSIVIGGGVAANQFLRSQFSVHSSRLGIPVFFPPKELSIDNGAMIAAAAFFTGAMINPVKIQSTPNLHL